MNVISIFTISKSFIKSDAHLWDTVLDSLFCCICAFINRKLRPMTTRKMT